MHKKNKILLPIGLLLIGGLSLVIYLSPSKVGEGKFRLHNNAYACGDCYPQYEIMEIVDSEDLKGDGLLGELVYVDFTPSMEEEISRNAEKCVICYDYLVAGVLYRTFSSSYKIKARELSLKETFKGCCSK